MSSSLRQCRSAFGCSVETFNWKLTERIMTLKWEQLSNDVISFECGVDSNGRTFKSSLFLVGFDRSSKWINPKMYNCVTLKFTCDLVFLSKFRFEGALVPTNHRPYVTFHSSLLLLLLLLLRWFATLAALFLVFSFHLWNRHPFAYYESLVNAIGLAIHCNYFIISLTFCLCYLSI